MEGKGHAEAFIIYRILMMYFPAMIKYLPLLLCLSSRALNSTPGKLLYCCPSDPCSKLPFAQAPTKKHDKSDVAGVQ